MAMEWITALDKRFVYFNYGIILWKFIILFCK